MFETQPQFDRRTKGNCLTEIEAKSPTFLNHSFCLLDVFDIRKNHYTSKDEMLILVFFVGAGSMKTFLLKKDFLIANGILSTDGSLVEASVGKCYQFTVENPSHQLALVRT